MIRPSFIFRILNLTAIAIILGAGGYFYFGSAGISLGTFGNYFDRQKFDLKVDNGASRYNGYVCNKYGKWECERWADQVVKYSPGKKKNGGNLANGEKDPTKALGEAQNDNSNNYVSLGFGDGETTGVLKLYFANEIVNGPGDDLEVFETSNGNPSFANNPEAAEVYVSETGEANSWSFLGIAKQDSKFNMDSGTQLGAPFVLERAHYVALIDASNKTSNKFNGNANGYDVDGVKALHCGSDPSIEGGSCQAPFGPRELGTQYACERFWDLKDVKPGDSGRSVISVHVNKPSWACVVFGNYEDNENTLIDPEAQAGDNTPGPLDGGELGANIDIFAWRDGNGNGFYEPLQGETVITHLPFDSVNFLALADSTSGTGPIGNGTKYVGLAWCIGEFSVNGLGGLFCDGAGVPNTTQTDSLILSVILSGKPSQDNAYFKCSSLPIP